MPREQPRAAQDEHGKAKLGRPRTFQRDHAIESALEHYWRDGLHALSVNEICRRAGISKPALYREFGGEDGLIDAALAHYHKTAIQPLVEAMATSQSFDEFSNILLGALSTERVGERGCLFVKARDAPDRLGVITSARLEKMLEEVRTNYEALYARALARGEVRTDVSQSVAAAYLDTLVTTLFRQRAAGESAEAVCRYGRLALDALLPGREE